MGFSKSFPRTVEGSTYPIWEEIKLTEKEEKEEEAKCRKKNISLMKGCVEDAKEVMKDKTLKNFQSDLINIAISLFEKRASHAVYWKESKAKKKFDELF